MNPEYSDFVVFNSIITLCRQNVEMETFISTIKELERSNQKLVEKNIKLDELEKKRYFFFR